eukprot:6348776-Prorocentrum_lima.AAC.1
MVRSHLAVRSFESKEALADVIGQAEVLAPVVWEAILTSVAFTDITFPPSQDSIGGQDKHVKSWRRAR